VLAAFFEQFLETNLKLADSAVALEAQRNIARRRHVLVYARKGTARERRKCRTGESGQKKRTPSEASFRWKFDLLLLMEQAAQEVCCCWSRRFCLISLILSRRSSACFCREARSSALSTMSAL